MRNAIRSTLPRVPLKQDRWYIICAIWCEQQPYGAALEEEARRVRVTSCTGTKQGGGSIAMRLSHIGAALEEESRHVRPHS